MAAALTLSVRVRGLEAFPGRPDVQRATERALQRTQRAYITRAQRALSGRFVRVRTGRLRRGFNGRIRRTGDTFVASIRNRVFYGQILATGAKAHVIPEGPTRGERRRGLRQRVLRFQVGGRTVYARQVVHPGLRPRPWDKAALEEAIPEMQAAFEQEFGALGQSRIIDAGTSV